MKTRIKSLYDKTYWFSDADAWMLFRLAAFTEAFTWTMLISSIIVRNMNIPGGDIAVSISGTIHGAMLMIYIAFLCMLSRSMEWGAWRFGGGFIAGNIPYATIVFEQITAKYRRRHPVSVKAPIGYMED